MTPPATALSAPDVFWGEIAPCEHLVQIYEERHVFLDTLEGFIGGGLDSGDAAIIIATRIHRYALAERLEARGFDLDAARRRDQYIDLDAEQLLANFMIDGWPDDDLFERLITSLLHRARDSGRQVRAFGEMVAILWAAGHTAATVRLEHLWHSLCERESFSLFCAYPKSGFTDDAETSIRDICKAHSRLVSGKPAALTRRWSPYNSPR
jgi:hypothetical protein